jgi:hypothetical protein
MLFKQALLAGSIADLLFQQAREAVADVSMHLGRDVEKVRNTRITAENDRTSDLVRMLLA